LRGSEKDKNNLSVEEGSSKLNEIEITKIEYQNKLTPCRSL